MTYFQRRLAEIRGTLPDSRTGAKVLAPNVGRASHLRRIYASPEAFRAHQEAKRCR